MADKGVTMLEEGMPKRLPPGCMEQSDGPGKPVRIYYRANVRAKKTRLHGTPWTPEFMAQYDEAKGCAPKAPKSGIGVRPDTWGWLCAKYITECADYKRLDPRTRKVRKQTLDLMCEEPIAPGSTRIFKDMPLARMSADDIEVLRDRKLDTPEAANGRVKAARQVTKWGLKKKYLKTNIARDVEYFRSGSTGFHTWTLEEVEAFEERWPIGTKARLALALLMFTGQRRSDIIRFGKQHVREGLLTFTQFKGRKTKPKRLVLPILPELQRIIDATPGGDLTFLINDLGRAFTDAGFGNKMRDWCNAAGLHHCSAHGCRKAGATIAAENGATARQLMAVFGWDSMKQAELYTRAADQKRLAAGSMHLIAASSIPGLGIEPQPPKAP
jgi:integrase